MKSQTLRGLRGKVGDFEANVRYIGRFCPQTTKSIVWLSFPSRDQYTPDRAAFPPTSPSREHTE